MPYHYISHRYSVKNLFLIIIFFAAVNFWPGLLLAQTNQLPVSAKDNEKCLVGYKDSSGRWLIQPQFISAGKFDPDFAIVFYGEKFGLIDTKGQFILPARYDELKECSNGQYIYRMAEHNGVILSSGKELLKEIKGSLFCNGRGYTVKNEQQNLFGYIDSDGTIIQPQFRNALSFRSRLNTPGVAHFTTDSTEGFITRKGEKIYEGAQGSIIENFNGNGFFAGMNGTYHIYLWTGKLLYPKVVDSVWSWFGNPINIIEGGKYKLIDENGHVISGGYDFIDRFSVRGSAVCRLNGKYGLLDKSGRELLHPLYDEIKTPDVYDYYNIRPSSLQIYIPVRKGNLYGIINDTGGVVIEPKYNYVLGINSNTIMVALADGKLLALNLHSLDPLPLKMAGSIIEYNDGQIVFRVDTNYGIADGMGNVIVKPMYQIIQPWNNNFVVRKKDLYGVVNPTGEEIIPTRFKQILIYYQRSYTDAVQDDRFLYVQTQTGYTGVLDINYNWVLDTIYKNLSYFDSKQSVFWVMDKDSTWGIADENGKIISREKYDYNGVFNDDRCIVVKNNRIGLIDITGKTLLPCIYDQIIPEVNGFYWYSKDSLWGLADFNGKKIIGPILQDFMGFNNICAFGKTDGHWGVIDLTGSFTIGYKRLWQLSAQNEGENLSENEGGYRAEYIPIEYNFEEGYPFTSGVTIDIFLLKDSQNSRREVALNDRILDMAHMAHENAVRQNLSGTVILGDSPYEEGWQEPSGSGWSNIYSYMTLNLTKNTCTISASAEQEGHGTSNRSETKTNYLFTGDSLQALELDELFAKSDYKAVLSRLCMKQIKDLDGVEIECSNPENLVPVQNFEITDDGLVFWFVNHAVVENDGAVNDANPNYFPLTIAYKDIASVVNKRGALRGFY
ncbi:MAG: repeat protein [Bacteroidota bacterium]|nr:repeat protein [Bacteroidota bacterium]